MIFFRHVGACSSCGVPLEPSLMDTRRILIVAGVMLVVAGIAWPWLRALPLGRLPGDIAINRPGLHIYIPIATCVLISVVLTLLFWIFRK